MVRARRRGSGRRPKEGPEAPGRVRAFGPPAAPQVPRSSVAVSLPVKAEGRRVIRAPVQKVFPIIGRLEGQPRVTGLWLSADVLDRRPGQLTVHYRGYFAGVPLESVQRVMLQPPHRVEFRQTRGGLRSLQGDYALEPADGETELTMSVEADIGIPLITDAAAARVLRGYVERTLDKIKLTAERELPRVIRRREEPPAPVTTGIEPAPLSVGDQDGVDEVVEPTEAAVPAVPEESPPPAPAIAETSRPPGTKRRRRRRRRRRQPTQPTQPTQSPAKPNQSS
jgi:hypothetical protein